MPTRKFSLAHLTILEAPPPELIRIAARTGYDFVGLRLIPLGLPGEVAYAPHDDAVMRRDIKAAIDDTGVKVLDVELARSSRPPRLRATCRRSKRRRNWAPSMCYRVSGCAIAPGDRALRPSV